MKKKLVFALACMLATVSCSKFEFDQQVSKIEKDTEAINENASTILGDIDPNQDWNSISSGTVAITADANLDDIVKVQILTESPFMNSDAKVLNEVSATNGQTVELNFDAPNIYTKLIAACVNSAGV